MTLSMQHLNDRQRKTLELLEQSGEVRVVNLKEIFGVTEMTVRRDLEKLEQAGRVRRTFGGAILVTQDISLSERSGIFTAEKIRIGKAAAGSIQDGDSVFIDGGSTTLQVVRHLPSGLKITAVTNALNLAAELLTKNIPTLVTGGMVLETTSTMIGPVCAEALSRMAFDKVFLGTTGISPLHGFSNSNMYEAEIKRMAVSRAGEVHILADASKFGVKDLFSFASLSDAHRIWTDKEPDGEVRPALAEVSAELIVCE